MTTYRLQALKIIREAVDTEELEGKICSVHEYPKLPPLDKVNFGQTSAIIIWGDPYLPT